MTDPSGGGGERLSLDWTNISRRIPRIMRRPFLAVTLVVAPDLTKHTDVIVGVVNTVFCRRGAFAILGAELETDLFPHGSNVCFNLKCMLPYRSRRDPAGVLRDRRALESVPDRSGGIFRLSCVEKSEADAGLNLALAGWGRHRRE